MNSRPGRIESIASEATQWRRSLHQQPQTMYEEEFASAFVAQKLTEWGVSHERGIARTGIVATIEGRYNRSGRVLAFRADMDALNLQERSGQLWASTIPGKMHACGHDGHTSTILVLARYLHETRNFDGIIRLLFQPAEEGGRGAFRMIDEGLLSRFPFDEIYGYHNWPALPRGVFAVCPGPMLAGADVFDISLTGIGGHAAMPHLTRDVVPAASQLVLALQTLVSRETDPLASAVVSVTNLNAGSGAINVTADKVRLTGTVRTFRQDLQTYLEDRIRAIVGGIAGTFRLDSEFHYEHIVAPTVNDPACTVHCRAAAAALVGKANVREQSPLMGSEDFGAYLEHRRGAFMGSSLFHVGSRVKSSLPAMR